MRCPAWKTEDGFDMQFGVNHLGTLLTGWKNKQIKTPSVCFHYIQIKPLHHYLILIVSVFLQATSCWQIFCWISWKSPPPAEWSTWPHSPTSLERLTLRTWTGRRRSLILSRRTVRASLPMFCSPESSPNDYKASRKSTGCFICGHVWEGVRPMFLLVIGHWLYIFKQCWCVCVCVCVTGTGVTVNAVHPGVVATELGRHTGLHQSQFSSSVLSEYPASWLDFTLREINKFSQVLWTFYCYLHVLYK